MKLRLYHHRDGARIAYREAGTGPPLALLHSAGLSHREYEPLVEELGDRFRLVLPDLPLHGDSEDRPRHPYTPDWIVEVLAGFVRDTCGPRPLLGGHDVGALIALRAVVSRQLQPSKLILTEAADALSREAQRNPAAGLQLGFLIGAAERGARTTGGQHAELIRRLQGAVLLDGAPAASRAAFRRGEAAGKARG